MEWRRRRRAGDDRIDRLGATGAHIGWRSAAGACSAEHAIL